MKPDLETLKTEIEQYLGGQEFVVFRGPARSPEFALVNDWDVEQYPDFTMFLDVPKQLGVRLIRFHHVRLSPAYIDDTMDQLDAAEMPDDEYAETRRRLEGMRAYEGHTAEVQLAFEYEDSQYCFRRRAEWFEELMDITGEIDEFGPDLDDLDEPDDEAGRYFSKN